MSEWPAQRLGTLATVRLSSVDKQSSDGECHALLCNYRDVYYRHVIDQSIEFMAASASPIEFEKFELRRGDVLITKDSESWTDIAVPAVVIEDLKGVLCGYHLALLRPNSRVLDGRFLNYALRAAPVAHQFRARAVGITRYGLSLRAIKDASVPLPNKDDQQRIVDYLDAKTAKIDALITKKQRLIELLHEKRFALITNAVTKGLDPSVRVKDSGVEWLGEIPEHWHLRKLKHAFETIASGYTPPRDEIEWYDGSVPWVTTGELRENVISDTINKIHSDALHRFPALRLHSPDTLLIAMYGATIGRLGVLGTSACTNQACCALSGPRNLDPWFVFCWLIAFRKQIIHMGYGGGQPNISQEIIENLWIPAPTLREQRSIVDFLRGETAKVNAAANTTSAGIEKLREYRAALISAAVTGKIDVREAS